MTTAFKPIHGGVLAAATPRLVLTAAADNTIVTSLSAVVPVGTTGTPVVTLHRVPVGQIASAATVVASQTLSPGQRLDLRNVFLNTGDFITAVSDLAGPVISGNYSTP